MFLLEEHGRARCHALPGQACWCHFFESLRLPFQRELHLFPQAPSSSEGGGCNRSSSELKPLCYKVGGPSEVCARFFVRDEPQGHGACDFCWFCCRLLLVVCSFGSYMARLHWEGVASCPPNVEWLIFSVQC